MKKSELIEKFCIDNLPYLKQKVQQDPFNIDYINGTQVILHQIRDRFFEDTKKGN